MDKKAVCCVLIAHTKPRINENTLALAHILHTVVCAAKVIEISWPTRRVCSKSSTSFRPISLTPRARAFRISADWRYQTSNSFAFCCHRAFVTACECVCLNVCGRMCAYNFVGLSYFCLSVYVCLPGVGSMMRGAVWAAPGETYHPLNTLNTTAAVRKRAEKPDRIPFVLLRPLLLHTPLHSTGC